MFCLAEGKLSWYRDPRIELKNKLLNFHKLNGGWVVGYGLIMHAGLSELWGCTMTNQSEFECEIQKVFSNYELRRGTPRTWTNYILSLMKTSDIKKMIKNAVIKNHSANFLKSFFFYFSIVLVLNIFEIGVILRPRLVYIGLTWIRLNCNSLLIY